MRETHTIARQAVPVGYDRRLIRLRVLLHNAPLMIFTLVVVNSKTLQLLAARWPRVERFLVPVPPAALGTSLATD